MYAADVGGSGDGTASDTDSRPDVAEDAHHSELDMAGQQPAGDASHAEALLAAQPMQGDASEARCCLSLRIIYLC